MYYWIDEQMSNSRELQQLRSLNGGRISERKHRRDKSEISCCLKYLIFGFNVIFWVSYTDQLCCFCIIFSPFITTLFILNNFIVVFDFALICKLPYNSLFGLFFA